jgi:erythromycin esterase-like protein
VYLIGFGSYRGTVIAGDAWGAHMKIMEIPPARNGSLEDLLHKKSNNNRYFILDEEKDDLFYQRKGHRAIGVVYHPERERFGNYVSTILNQRYDAFVYIDETTALHPLHIHAGKEMPETYPFGV